jgi:hypothetical protein
MEDIIENSYNKYTVASRQADRDEIARLTEEFLAKGGKVQEIPCGVSAEDCYVNGTN